MSNFIEPKGSVAVLSAFPFFIVEYFGMNKIDFISSTILTAKSITGKVEFLSRENSNNRHES